MTPNLLTIINCNFNNIRSANNGSIIKIENGGSKLEVNDTLFKNISTENYGAALFIKGFDQINIYSSNFILNQALEGGSLYF